MRGLCGIQAGTVTLICLSGNCHNTDAMRRAWIHPPAVSSLLRGNHQRRDRSFSGRKLRGSGMALRTGSVLACVLVASLGGCNWSGDAVPLPPAGSGFLYDGFLLPTARVFGVIEVGQTVEYTYSVYDSQNNRYPNDFGPVSWSNETPTVLSLAPTGSTCGDRCMGVTRIAAGFGQVRASATYKGSHVAAVASFPVR